MGEIAGSAAFMIDEVVVRLCDFDCMSCESSYSIAEEDWALSS